MVHRVFFIHGNLLPPVAGQDMAVAPAVIKVGDIVLRKANGKEYFHNDSGYFYRHFERGGGNISGRALEKSTSDVCPGVTETVSSRVIS